MENVNQFKVEKAKQLFRDTQSIDFFNKWISFRKTLLYDYYPFPTNDFKGQYFIDSFKNSQRFVDCGGYIGDTVIEYYKYNDGKVITFEPDINNLLILNKNVKGKNVLIFPLGVSNKTQILKFNQSGSSGKFDDDGDMLVSVISLDETIYNFKPDYIKMDIEGSEKDAILGTKNIIKDFSPNLAISLYHKADDLWEIPLLINEINSNYEFYLRSHQHFCWETVLYCKNKQ